MDPNIHRYANMTYINYLNRQQRLIERGQMNDEFDDDEDDAQSEDDSEISNSGLVKEKTKLSDVVTST